MFHRKTYMSQGRNSLYWGWPFNHFIGNPHNGYINPYYWVDFRLSPINMEMSWELIDQLSHTSSPILVPSLPQLLSRFHKPRIPKDHVDTRVDSDGRLAGWKFHDDNLEKSFGVGHSKPNKNTFFFPPPVGETQIFVIPQVWYWGKIKQEVVSAQWHS